MLDRLAKVQSELNAPKNQYNSYGNYKYRSCEDILASVKPLLAANGLSMTISDEVLLVGERFYIQATVRVTDVKDPTQYITTKALAREPLTQKGMADSQVTGTASSYARKYALNGMFLIDDTKDADTDEFHKQTSDKEKDNKVKAEGREEMIAFLEKNMPEERKQKMLEAYHISEIKYMKQADLTKVYAKIKAGE